MLVELLLVTSLGLLGSFGHCAGMCGPLTAAFSLSSSARGWQALGFHLLLNSGRLLSYSVIGGAIGGLGSVVVAGGQMAGVGSDLRQGMAIATGLLLIWTALARLFPELLPKLPLVHPLTNGWHDRLQGGMQGLLGQSQWWTPIGLGFIWGLIPCGFLYTAQIKAAAAGDIGLGAMTMLAFGLGTLPVMVGVGVSTSRLSRDRRSQLFRLGSWVTLIIGILMLLRTGETTVDYTGHGALILLAIALVARPLSQIWSAPLHYRRALGVGAYILALAHTGHTLEHALGWNPDAFFFLLPLHQWGFALGMASLVLMTPAALTSFDRAQKALGANWRRLHLLGVPALGLAGLHAICIGSSYLGSSGNEGQAIALGSAVLLALLLRCAWFWSFISRRKDYVPPHLPSPRDRRQYSSDCTCSSDRPSS